MGNKIIIIPISTIILLIIVVLALCAYVSWKLTHPKRYTLPNIKDKIPKYEEVSFKSHMKNIILNGFYFGSSNSDKTVILAHGYSVNRFQFQYESPNFINSFIKKGFNLLLFDFRNSGESGGNSTTVGCLEQYDLKGAIDFIVNHKKCKTVILIGFSMGAAVSIVVGSEDSRVNCIIADSPFSDLKEYIQSKLSFWSKLPRIFNPLIIKFNNLFTKTTINNISPKSSIKSYINRPILLIHGKGDTAIPYINSMEIRDSYLEAGGTNIEYYNPGDTVNHVMGYLDNQQEYLKKVFEFLSKIDLEKPNSL